jgi:hypothetical protein
MANPTIDTSALLKMGAIFSVDTRKKILAAAGKRMGIAAESVVPDYPPPSGKPRPKIYLRTAADGSLYYSAFESQAQQGKVFSLFNQGKVPYPRSGTLGRSITSAISNLTGESVTVSIGTTINYAPDVIGDDGQQAAYHKGHWWQLSAVMAENAPMIEQEGQKALSAEVEKELRSR